MTDTHEIDRELVMAWMDGELPPAEAKQIATHVDTCAPCRQLVADLRDVSARISTWSVPPAPVSLRAPDVPSSPAAARKSWMALPRLPRWSYVLTGAAGIAVVWLVSTPMWMMRSMPVNADMDAQLSRRQAGSAAPGGGFSAPAAPAIAARPRREGVVGGVPGDAPAQGQQGQRAAESQSAVSTLMIIRTASLEVFTEKFDEARASLERLVRTHEGSIAQLQVTGHQPSSRTLGATVRVPNARMDAALEAIRQIGKVRQESQASDDVTDSFRDLSVRIANARVEERRLNELLARRTGDLSDVLAVEQEVMRVRGEIERMDAQARAVQGRVAQSTITVQISEAYRADLATGAMPLTTRLKNALVDGTRGAIDSLIALALGLLTVGPVMIVWGALLGLPIWFILRRRARRGAR